MNKKSWEIVVEVLNKLRERAIPGASCVKLDILAQKIIKENGGVPFNKGYKPKWAKTPFPSAVCFSVNNEIAHGFPTLDDGSPKILKDGDIVNFDVGIKKDGLCGDAAITVGIGDISSRNERLLINAKKTLEEGIRNIKDGVKVGEISRAMETFAESRGFVLNKNLTGHGIGKEMHMEPRIFNFYALDNLGNNVILREGGMVCIEPQLTYKDRIGMQSDNGWTILTRDGRNSAFFEHQALITKDGHKILTDGIL